MILLTDTEMKEAGRDYHRDGRWTERMGLSRDRAIAKTQAQKIIAKAREELLAKLDGAYSHGDTNVLQQLREEIENHDKE